MERQKGFTLIEIFLASSILTVMVIALSVLFILSLKANAAAGDQTECVALAQARMERLKHQDYDTLADGGDVLNPVSGYSETFDVDGNATNDYLVAWAVSDNDTLPGASGIHVKQLDVRCRPLRGETAQLGRPKVVDLVSYRTRGIHR